MVDHLLQKDWVGAPRHNFARFEGLYFSLELRLITALRLEHHGPPSLQLTPIDFQMFTPLNSVGTGMPSDIFWL